MRFNGLIGALAFVAVPALALAGAATAQPQAKPTQPAKTATAETGRVATVNLLSDGRATIVVRQDGKQVANGYVHEGGSFTVNPDVVSGEVVDSSVTLTAGASHNTDSMEVVRARQAAFMDPWDQKAQARAAAIAPSHLLATQTYQMADSTKPFTIKPNFASVNQPALAKTRTTSVVAAVVPYDENCGGISHWTNAYGCYQRVGAGRTATRNYSIDGSEDHCYGGGTAWLAKCFTRHSYVNGDNHIFNMKPGRDLPGNDCNERSITVAYGGVSLGESASQCNDGNTVLILPNGHYFSTHWHGHADSHTHVATEALNGESAARNRGSGFQDTITVESCGVPSSARGATPNIVPPSMTKCIYSSAHPK